MNRRPKLSSTPSWILSRKLAQQMFLDPLKAPEHHQRQMCSISVNVMAYIADALEAPNYQEALSQLRLASHSIKDLEETLRQLNFKTPSCIKLSRLITKLKAQIQNEVFFSTEFCQSRFGAERLLMHTLNS